VERSPGRGHFETLRGEESGWEISGWILHPDRPTTRIRARRDGETVGDLPPLPREDVGRAFPAIPHAAASGFRFALPSPTGRTRLVVECLEGGTTLVEISTTLAPELLDLPTPPAELMRRVTGSPEAGFFLADGLRSYTEFLDAFADHRASGSLSRMLDWGCGCGRLSRLFLGAHPGLEVHGCDIDAEAVDWCRRHLAGGRFLTVDPMPPTPYEDGTFDLVLGYSVFSHLLPEAQLAWLAEIRRILSPGGLLLASVHGPFAARFALVESDPAAAGRDWRRSPPIVELLERGFLDAGEDRALEGIAPDGYYRGVFQTPEWTRRHWSEVLRVLEIREAGMQNYQDLVILEKP